MEQETQNNKPGKKRKYILLGIAGGTLVLAGVGVWFFFFRDKKGAKVADPENDLFKEAEKGSKNLSEHPTYHTPKKITSGGTNNSPGNSVPTIFPIKKGRKGGLVETMQNGLIKNYGAKIKADGDFGSKTEAALLKAGFSPIVDEESYRKIIQRKPANSLSDLSKNLSTSEVIALASSLKDHLTKENFWGFIGELKKAKGKENYKALNEAFKAQMFDGSNKDISVAALETFTDSQQQAYLLIYFNQLGLKYEGENKYTVSGIFNNKATVTTIVSCNVFLSDGSIVKVPTGTTIGVFIEKEKGVLKVKGFDGNHYFIHAKDTDYVQAIR